METKYIEFIEENGEKTKAELLLSFLYQDNKFVVYTFGEKDSNDMMIVYSSKVIETPEGKKLEKPSSEQWNEIKQIMNQIVKEGANV
jgi:uncharacterized protein YrzB (UPF0473 family)